jgi:hypothetical protein
VLVGVLVAVFVAVDVGVLVGVDVGVEPVPGVTAAAAESSDVLNGAVDLVAVAVMNWPAVSGTLERKAKLLSPLALVVTGVDPMNTRASLAVPSPASFLKNSMTNAVDGRQLSVPLITPNVFAFVITGLF